MAQWITVWAQAHADMSMLCKSAKDYTARITVFSEVGGEKIRFRLSNQEGKAPAVVEGVSVQVEDQAPVLMRFGGKPAISLNPGETAYSDPVELHINPGDTVTASLAFKGAAISGNNLPEAIRLSTKGNYTTTTQMPVAKQGLMMKLSGVDPVLPVLSSIEVYTEEKKDVLVCFGDSITQMSRWTKPLADKLNAAGCNKVVINKGIAGNQLLSDPMIKMMAMYGKAAVKRFEEDVLNVAGATSVIFALGVNDMNMVPDEKAIQGKAEAILSGLEKLAAQAKAKGMKTYIATVTPCGGCKGYRGFTNSEREKLNKLIRANTSFDGILDFDAVVRDPKKPDAMQEICDSGDHLHPGTVGGQKMARAAYTVLTGKATQ